MKVNKKTSAVVGLGILTAIVIVLQAFASGIRFGVFSITLVLAPIIVGAALYGALAGAWLGLVFGIVVLITDASVFLAISVPGTIVTCLLKGIAAGAVAGLIYRALSKKNRLLAVIVAAIAAPVANTGLFLLGCRLFFYPTIQDWAQQAGFANAGSYLILGMVGVNFLVEAAVNLVLSSAIVQIVNYASKQMHAAPDKA